MNAKRTRNYYDMFAIMFNFQKSYRKYVHNTHLGLLTETHEVLLRLIKTSNIHIFKMAAPTEDQFPQTIIVGLEKAAMGWVLRLITIVRCCLITRGRRCLITRGRCCLIK